jgi:hypothetical protein
MTNSDKYPRKNLKERQLAYEMNIILFKSQLVVKNSSRIDKVEKVIANIHIPKKRMNVCRVS